MADPHYPTIEKNFFTQLIENNTRVIPGSKTAFGRTTVFVMIGNSPIHRRMVNIRENRQGTIPYECATGIAARVGCMGDLLIWLEENRNWKDGAYVAQQKEDNSNN
jgi:hypothetical protein